MENKVLFLDIDGVLNSEEWYISLLNNKIEPIFPDKHINPKQVTLVNKIINQTNATVILSSSWRIFRSVEEMNILLKRKGATFLITDLTPILSTGCRGDEIALWIEKSANSIESFCILDDDSDMSNLSSNLIQTSWQFGITEKHVNLAIKMLNKDI